MAHTNRNSLQIEDDTQDVDAAEFFSDEDDWEEDNTSSKKKQILNDRKRGRIRRNIEEIKERRRLQELLGDDYDELEFLDS
jgi:hypothetical protein